MNSVKMVYVKQEGVLGFIVHEYPDKAALVAWYYDALRFERVLDEDEYEVKFMGVVYE